MGYHGDFPIGLLALQKNTSKGLPPSYQSGEKEFYEFFGGDDTDSNVIFFKPGYENYRDAFLQEVPKPAYLTPLLHPYPNSTFRIDKFCIQLKGLHSYEDYVNRDWHGSSRSKLLGNVRSLYRDYTIEVVRDQYEDLDLLFKFNQDRFGQESSFHLSYRQKIFRNFIDIYDVEMLTIGVNGVKQGVSYAIKFKDSYIAMNLGVSNEINNLGKLFILLRVGRAIALGCDIFDAGKGENGWKNQFKLSKIPQYLLKI